MDGNTTTFTDSSTTGNTATGSASGISYQQASLLSGATPGYSISTVPAGYITAPRLAAMDGAYTAIVLLKPTAIHSLYLWHKGDFSTVGQQGHTVHVDADGKLLVQHFNEYWSDVSTSNAVFVAGEKVWLACVYNGATTFTIYKNGAYLQQLTLPNAFVSNTQPLYLNGVRVDGVTQYGMAGGWDEFVWFNYQLTGGQLSALFEES